MFKLAKKEDETFDIKDSDVVYTCLIKRTKRKSVSISIKSVGTVVIHSPMYTMKRTLKKIATENISWIANKIDLVNSRRERTAPVYEDGGRIVFMGNYYIFKIGVNQKQDTLLEGNIISVRDSDSVAVRLSVKSFYRREASKLFAERVKYWIPLVPDASPQTKLVIKQMSTRWGSMSSSVNGVLSIKKRTHTMNLNIALIRTPIECIDYVIVHELCHQRHPHHQPPFWTFVKSVMPDYKNWEKVLKSYPTDDY